MEMFKDAVVDYISVLPDGSLDKIKYYLPRCSDNEFYDVVEDILHNSHLITHHKPIYVEFLSLIYIEFQNRKRVQLSSNAVEYVPLSTTITPLQKSLIYIKMNNYIGNQMDEHYFVPINFIFMSIKSSPEFLELSEYTFKYIIMEFPSIIIKDDKYNLNNQIRSNKIIQQDVSLIKHIQHICSSKTITINYLLSNPKIRNNYNVKRLLYILETSKLFTISNKKISLITI
jgi:hypothetical protein